MLTTDRQQSLCFVAAKCHSQILTCVFLVLAFVLTLSSSSCDLTSYPVCNINQDTNSCSSLHYFYEVSLNKMESKMEVDDSGPEQIPESSNSAASGHSEPESSQPKSCEETMEVSTEPEGKSEEVIPETADKSEESQLKDSQSKDTEEKHTESPKSPENEETAQQKETEKSAQSPAEEKDEEKSNETGEQTSSSEQKTEDPKSSGDSSSTSQATVKSEDTDESKSDKKEAEGSSAEKGGKGDAEKSKAEATGSKATVEPAVSGATTGKAEKSKAPPRVKPGPGKTSLLESGPKRSDAFHEISTEIYEFPKTLEEFGFKFNEAGELRSIDKDEPFVFAVRDSVNYNQQRYEALGEIITEYIYGLLENELKLERHPIPVKATQLEGDPITFFYASPKFTEKEKLIVLIHGSGVVRAGQWTRKLIINENLEKGTQIPYIKWALENDYGVVVLNPNINFGEVWDDEKKEYVPEEIRGSRTPEMHALYVWDQYIVRTRIRYVAYIAHSYGGICVSHVAQTRPRDFQPRVFAIALTDSIHSLELQSADAKTKRYFRAVARNWVGSDRPLDTPMPIQKKPDAPRVSAGTTRHEWTSHMAKESVFKFVKQRLEDHKVEPYKDDSWSCNVL